MIEGPNVCDQIEFYAFHSFLVKVQTNSGYIPATHASWRLVQWNPVNMVTKSPSPQVPGGVGASENKRERG